MTIKVLADSKKGKAQGLLQVTKRLLDELGSADFRLQGPAQPAELILKARHRGTLDPLLCQVKAVPRDIGPDHLRGFLKFHARQQRKDKRLLGLFICLSRLSAPAQEWAQKNGEARRHFHLFGVDKVAALLKRAKLVTSAESFSQVVRARLRVEADGQPASKWIAQEIKRLDPALEGKRFYDLQLRERVLLALLDLQKRNLEELAKETRDPSGDVRPAVQDLVKEQMLQAEPVANPRWKFDRYTIRAEMEIFLSLARQFLEGPHRFKFLASSYAARGLASDVPKYLERRLRLTSGETG